MVDEVSPFTFNLKEFIIDEIALDGFEGIGIDSLWKRLEARTSSPISEKMQDKWWNFIVNCKSISIYELPVPAKRIEIIDRFSIVNLESGYVADPDFYLDGEFEYHPIDGENGSCKDYHTRKLLSEDIQQLPYKTILAKHGDHLVLVASAEERWKALASHLPVSYISQVPLVNYCLLELIGRARENGQMTSGKTNLTKMVKDSKILFYYRKFLQDLGMIRVSYITMVTGGKTVKGLLLRLRRFHKPIVQTVPKIGLLRDLVDYLKEQPNYCEPAENVMRQRLMTPMQYKRFQKKANIFHFEDKLVTLGETTNPNVKPKLHRRRYMCLIANSDDSSNSEDEEVAPLKCQYKVGVNLMRQAYERFLEAGRNGLTQFELAQILGIEFYVSRSICRVFKKKNIVREFVEYKGKQRMGRYIAIAATSKMDDTFAKEQEKLQKYLNEGKNTSLKRSASSDTEPLSHKKRRKHENDVDATDSVLDNITEVDEIVENCNFKHRTKLNHSLRHIKFASGIVKVLNERTFVTGYQTLSNLVSKEVNEPPMDTKAIKIFLHNMMMEGHIKVFKIKLSRIQNQYSILICAPHVQKTDPILKAKYKEIESRARFNKEITQKKLADDRLMSLYAFPRYVKVQKLHESLMKIVYFSDVKSEPSDLPRGFFAMNRLIPELPLGVALGHISSEGVIDIAKFTIENSMHEKKVFEVPLELQGALMNSGNLNSSLRTSLKILATFGLVQFCASEASRIHDNNLTINIFYLNKVAKVIDTTGIWPRTNKSAEDEKEFNFNSYEDVQVFWSTVYNISINTTIELPARKKAVIIKTPTRAREQVAQFDTGIRYGDGNGPCGYDSSFYMDLQRLWRAFCVRSTSRQVKEIKKVQIPKLERTKKPRKVRKKRTRKVPVKKPKPPIVVETIKPIDKIARRKKANEASVWSLEEDRLLMMCKAALTILSPLSQPGCLQVRNIVAKDILTINDPKKTIKTCHRRAVVIESNSTLIHERNWILNELRRHNDLLQKYEGLLKKLRTIYPTNVTKCINEARVPMMELVWVIYHLLKHMAQKQEIRCVVLDYENFNENYNILPASANRRLNLYRTPHKEIVQSTLKEAIILTVMLSYKNAIKKDSAKIIYSYFEKFPELVLRSAIEPVRKCSAIAAKEKILNSQMHIVDLNDIAQCSYRISAFYQRKWASRFSSEFADCLVECLNQNESETPIKAGGDTNCFCFEQHSIGALELVAITLPVITGSTGSIMQDEQLNVIDIETHFKLKSGKLGWKNKSNDSTLGQRYVDVPVESALEYLSRRSFIQEKDVPKKYEEEEIVSYLIQKGENGATFDELQESLKYDRKTLIEKVTELEANNIAKRVGFYENVLVLIEFVKNWTMKVKNGLIIPTPWLTLEADVRSEVFFQWAGVILNKVFEYPGCSVAYLSEVTEFLTTRAAQDICEVLQKCECVTLHSLKLKEPNLFSDEDDAVSEISAYNEYDTPKNILVLPLQDCLSKFSCLKKMMLDKLLSSE